MKIGISGAGGVGKTTLATVLGSRLKLPVISEGVREWLAHRGHNSPWRLSYDEQLELQRWFINWKIAAESNCIAFISDRTTIDAVVLSYLRFSNEFMRMQQVIDIAKVALTHAVATYDLIIVPRWDALPIVPDVCRTVNADIRRLEEELLLQIVHRLGIPLCYLIESDMKVRETVVLSMVICGSGNDCDCKIH